MKGGDRIRTLISLKSYAEPGHVHAVGAVGVLVEPLGTAGKAWLVEIAVRDETLVGERWFETVEMYTEEFEAIGDST